MQHGARSRPDLLDQLGYVVESRAARVALVVLIIVSVLPFPGVEETLRPLFLAAFGLELGVRIALLRAGRTERSTTEYLFLLIDFLAFLSFLPLADWFGRGAAVKEVLTYLRLARLLVLLRFARELAWDVYSIMTRREQLEQFGLVTGAVMALAFVTAVVLSQIDVPHDYDADPATLSGTESFWERMWWSFRQIESADNLVHNLQVQPLVAVLSLGLTITGVFIISFIIGLGANIVEQVVRAERRRRVGYRNHSIVVGAVGESELLVREFVRIYDKNRLLRRIRPRDVWNWWAHGAPAPRRHALPRMALLGPDHEPPAYLYDRGMRWVVYRTGEGADAEDLERVATPVAKRAILIADRRAGEDADAITCATLAQLRALNPTAHCFVEVLDSQNEPIIEAVGGAGTFPLDVPRFLGLFLCHHLVVPGVEALYRDLLTAAGCEFYTHIYVDPQENAALDRLKKRSPMLSFHDMARCAYERHGMILSGVFLAKDRLTRLPGDLVPVDRLVQWVNPAAIGDDEEVRSLGVSAGEIPAELLRGVFGVAQTYMPVQRYARAVLDGEGTLAPPKKPAPGKEQSPPPRAVDELLARAVCRERPLERVLVVGYSPALGWLLRALARFVPKLDVALAISARPDARTSLHDRLASLRMGIEDDPPPGMRGREVELDRGGRVVIYTHEAADLTGFAVKCVRGAEPVDAAVFLSDPESVDRDARTLMRVLRFARALEHAEVPRGESLHVLAELGSTSRGAQLEEHLNARRCGFADPSKLKLTLVSTDQIKNYFMVHSAFVPGVTQLYDKLLGARGQEIVRLDLDHRAAGLEGVVTMAEVMEALSASAAIPVALELADGDVRLNPAPDERFEAAILRGIYVIGERDRLPSLFPLSLHNASSAK